MRDREATHMCPARRHGTHGPHKGAHGRHEQDTEAAQPPSPPSPYTLRIQALEPRGWLSPYRVGLNTCPGPRLRSRATGRPSRGAAEAPRRYPCPAARMPLPCGHARFIHRRGPSRTQVGSRRGRRPSGAGVRGSRPRVPGWAHEWPMGSSKDGGGPQLLSQLDPNAEPLELDESARALATLQEGDKQLPSTSQGPFFYIGGTNGASIISSYCKNKGWQRIQDSRREDYKLKWCEVKSRDSYYTFREGEQLLYQLPNNKLLTTKIGLLSALREHSRASRFTRAVGTQARSGKDAALAPEESPWLSPGRPCPQRALRMEDFFPETYRLDVKEEREAFFTLFDETQLWICKPTASNQGKGIFLLRTQEEASALQARTQSSEEDTATRRLSCRPPQARVVQRYIQNPLLLDGKKFDVRSYLLIACAMPYMVFFGHGYARLTLNPYDPHSRDLSGHLTNQFMQKKSPLYVLLKEDTVWSMDHLNRYINDNFRKTKGLPRDWVFTTFTKRMQQIMVHCFLAVRSKLECKLGYFDLIGCDFLIDENFKVWLLEMNSNPALHTNCEVLKEVIPGVVVETLDLALETFQKSVRSQKMLPLLAQRRFVLLHNGEADLWPRLGGYRGGGFLRQLPVPRASTESALPSVPLLPADRPGVYRPAPPRRPPLRTRSPVAAHSLDSSCSLYPARSPDSAHSPDGSCSPDCAHNLDGGGDQKSEAPGREDPEREEASPGPADKESKSLDHRGS